MYCGDIKTCTSCEQYYGYKDNLLPVTYFGNPISQVLLVSLNPSHREYKLTSKKQEPLLRIDNCQRQNLNEKQIQNVLDRQIHYFETGLHLDWFDPAERFLNSIITKTWGRLSFGLNDNKAVVSNVDIVKCPTDPIWSELGLWQTLYINNCSEYFIDQLRNEKVKVIIINGKSVYEAINFIAEYTRKFELINVKRHSNVQILKLKKDGKNKEVNCTVYFDLIKFKGYDKKILVTGTSGRISSDGRGLFFDNHNELNQNAEVVISLMTDYINDMIWDNNIQKY